MPVSADCQRSVGAGALVMRPFTVSMLRCAISVLNSQRSDRSVEAIAEVAEAGDDVLLRVELAIDDRREDVDVRMLPLDERHTLGRRHDADHPDDRRA